MIILYVILFYIRLWEQIGLLIQAIHFTFRYCLWKSYREIFRWLCIKQWQILLLSLDTYELLNLAALKISIWYKNPIFQWMGKILCVEFQRYPLKFHTKYLAHTLKDVIFMQGWQSKNSPIQVFLKHPTIAGRSFHHLWIKHCLLCLWIRHWDYFCGSDLDRFFHFFSGWATIALTLGIGLMVAYAAMYVVQQRGQIPSSKHSLLEYVTGKYLALQYCKVCWEWDEPQTVGKTVTFKVKVSIILFINWFFPHWSWDKMTATFDTTFSNFFLTKIFVFWFKFL